MVNPSGALQIGPRISLKPGLPANQPVGLDFEHQGPEPQIRRKFTRQTDI
jgi:hypothetical protein